MTKRLTRGKVDRMQKLSDSEGQINALALDQRGSLKKMIQDAMERNGKAYNIQQVYDFKRDVSKVLSPHASAILLDEELGFEGIEAKDKNTGLIMSYEKTGYDVATPGREPELIPTQSAENMIANGADALKVLIYYNPNDPDEINDQKKAFAERYGTEAAAADIPTFFEIVTYDDKIDDPKGAEFAKEKPELVLKSAAEFTKPKYHMDVLKLEMPFNPDFVEGMTHSEATPVYTEAEVSDYLTQLGKIVTRPYIFLSGGVPTDTFMAQLKLAGEAHANFNGVLSGRATWKDGIEVYAKDGEDALIKWLETKGVDNINTIHKILNQYALPWVDNYGGKDEIDVIDLQVVTD
ncbi:tagatose 1,6-diphosphate aldolase [Levilactobacillus bambusae]|uniref:Tagatose 1,6-diphosphate aldolase n=1 Tax=Levilactobacillus bambusae TaxID=2024736 RepID=A0A2V1MY98_9LACO|nr:tagatose 1,6-diphosphate aldolase [Levilactobacillus bambusae]PWF99993.1 tagatose-bisphosphate aldolase [Levilactobacillus bambusae]